MHEFPEVGYPQDGAKAWEYLEQGNVRFASGELREYLQHITLEVNPELRQHLATGQHPYATILTCSDSRVCPELVFDEGLGAMFIIRVAGKVVDHLAIGSIEYGVDNLTTPVFVIMGHQSCGAVTAAMTDNEALMQTNIGAILTKIKPAVEEAKRKYDWGTHQAECLQEAIRLNVLNQKEQILQNSRVIREAVEAGHCKIVCCEYYLDRGEVRVIG